VIPGRALRAAATLVATLALAVATGTATAAPAAADCPGGGCSSIALDLLESGRVTFDDYHQSGVVDDATALRNIHQTAAGLPARRSSYGTAPGGSVYLSRPMLQGLWYIASAWRVRITEFAGGSHSATSYHYAGRALDIGSINGTPVSASNPHVARVMQSCRASGAIEVLGPGDAGHSTHIHCAW
jgi:hypothetical protein